MREPESVPSNSSEVNGVVFELYPLTPKSNPTTGTRIGLRFDSVEDVVKLLTNIGAVVVSPPADSEWGRRAVVKDYDGHVIELVTPARSPEQRGGTLPAS
jgi:predicted enzyme related to lactoylglutathione lyase